jgi:hypothetical protein
MTTFELQGRITDKGDLEIQLPNGLPAGNVTVRIDVPDASQNEDDERPYSKEELQALLEPHPKTGAEIAAKIRSGELSTSAWVAMNITDPVAWLEEQRRKQYEDRQRRE